MLNQVYTHKKNAKRNISFKIRDDKTVWLLLAVIAWILVTLNFYQYGVFNLIKSCLFEGNDVYLFVDIVIWVKFLAFGYVMTTIIIIRMFFELIRRAKRYLEI